MGAHVKLLNFQILLVGSLLHGKHFARIGTVAWLCCTVPAPGYRCQASVVVQPTTHASCMWRCLVLDSSATHAPRGKLPTTQTSAHCSISRHRKRRCKQSSWRYSAEQCRSAGCAENLGSNNTMPPKHRPYRWKYFPCKSKSVDNNEPLLVDNRGNKKLSSDTLHEEVCFIKMMIIVELC